MSRLTITAERIEHSGAWSISTVNEWGYRVARTYYGYTKREAIALFRRYLNREI